MKYNLEPNAFKNNIDFMASKNVQEHILSAH